MKAIQLARSLISLPFGVATLVLAYTGAFIAAGPAHARRMLYGILNGIHSA